MPVDRKDLAARVAAATAADTSRGVNFNSVFAVVKELADEPAARACDPAGKGSRIDFFAYPITEYLEIAWKVVDQLEGACGGVDRTFERLGRRTIRDFYSSLLGRTIFTLTGKDPRKLVSNAPPGYKSAVSYGDRSVQWLGERHGRIVMKRDFLVPAFHRGVILEGLEWVGAKGVKVDARATGLLDAEYDVSWESWQG
jgi:uncharacterized protein (TIGR02265 family)